MKKSLLCAEMSNSKASAKNHCSLLTYLLTFFLLFYGITQSQGATKTWVGAATGGAWTTAANWSSGTAPASSDDIVINAGTSVMTFTGMSSSTINSLTINGTTGSVTWSSGASTLTITSSFISAVNVTTGVIGISTSGTTSSIASGKTLTISSGNTLTIGSGGIFTVNGTITTVGAATAPIVTGATTRLVVPSGGVINYICGTSTATIPLMNVQTGGTLNISGSNTITLSAMAIAGTLSIASTGSTAISTSGTAPVYASGSTLIYLNCTAIPENAIAWPTGTSCPTNVTINSPNGVTITSSSGRQIKGTLTLMAGALTLSGASNTLTFNGTGSLAPIARTSGTITCTTTPSLSFSPTGAANWVLPSGTFTSAPTLTNFTSAMGSAGSLTLNDQAITVSGTSTLTSGIVILGSGNFTATTISPSSSSSYGSTLMYVTSVSSGYFGRTVGNSTYTYFYYPVGDNVGTTQYSPVTLYFSSASGTAARVISTRVIDAPHPNINTGGNATHYLSRYWQFTDNQSAAYTYTADFTFISGTEDVSGTASSILPDRWNGSAWTNPPGSTSSPTLSVTSTTYAANPLGGNDFTGLTQAPLNDNCTGAIAFGTLSQSCTNVTVNTTNATQSSSGCAGTADDDVWFSFVVPSGYTGVNFSTTNISGSTDRVFQFYSGTCGALTSILCSDPESGVVTGLTGGSTYYVRAYTYSSGASSIFTLCLSLPPINDNCTGAIAFPTLTLGACSSVTVNTAFATQSSSACAGTADDDVWYSFTMPTGGTSVSFSNTDISGSSDRVLQFYSGTCGSLTSLLCSDPESGTLSSLTGGNTYYVRAYTYGSSVSSNFTLTLCLPPANDIPCGAVLLTPGLTCSSTTGTAAYASESYSYAGCDYSYTSPLADVWYKFVASNTSLTVRVTGNGTYDPVVQAYSGACGSLSAISGACTDATGAGATENLQLSGLTVGSTYYVRVYHGSSTVPSNTTFTICILKPPDNDEPCGAVVLTPGYTCTATAGDVNLASQTKSYGGCDNNYTSPANDVWYSFVATNTSHVINVQGSSGMTALVQAYSGSSCSGTLTSIGCNLASANGALASLQLTGLTVGITYYVRVYASYYYTLNSTSSFTICVVKPPINDDCAGAIDLGTITSTCTGTAGDAALASQTYAHSSCDNASTARDVWFKFTTNSGGTTANIIVVSNGTYDAVVQAYSGACGSLSNLGCVQNWSGGTETLHLTGLTGSTTYYVRVYHSSSSIPSNTTFTICAVIPPVNDDCAGTALTLGATATSGTTVNASQVLDDYYYTGYDDDEVWYNFTSSGNNALITLNCTGIDGVVQLRRNICTGNKIVDHDFVGTGSAETIRVSNLTDGAQYGIRVFSYGSSTQGAFTIKVNNTGYTPGTYDNVANAYVASVGNNAPGASYASYGMEVGEPSGSNWAFDPDINPVSLANTAWFKFVPTVSGSYNISATTGGNQFLFAVYSASSAASLLSGGATEIGSSPVGSSASLNCVALTTGTNYFIQINGNMGATGTPAVTISNASPVVPVFSAGSATHCFGETDTYTATASGASSIIYNITSGGASINSNSGYVSNITSSFTVHAVANYACGNPTSADFNVSVATYSINSTAGSNGTISPLGSYNFACGNGQTYNIAANPGSHITDVLMDGVSVGAVSSYTFTNIQDNHSIAASFALDAITITASAGPNGSITPTGSLIITPGDNQTFDITADSCYQIADVLVDGVSVGTPNSYTFTNVQLNHSISVSFSAIPNVSVSIIASTNQVCSGTLVNFTATPTTGGSSPDFQWFNGTSLVGSGSIHYSYIAVNGDVITCQLTSNASCNMGSPALSNPIVMSVMDLPVVAVSGSNSICEGEITNLTPVSGGTWISNSPAFASVDNFGFVNGLAAGNATFTFTDNISQCSSTTPAVIIHPTPTAPQGTTNQSFCLGTLSTIADLVVSGNGIKWYDAASGGNLLSLTDALVDGITYYASQTNGNCESQNRLGVNVTITNIAAPGGNASQSVCNSGTIADIVASGNNIKWYDAATGGNVLLPTTALTNGTTYYASQTVGACESQTRLAVNIALNNTPPTGNATQSFCNWGTINDISISGSGIKWYDAITGGNLLLTNTNLGNGTTYYASQTIGACESESRFGVEVSINSPAPPSGNTMQPFVNIATVGDLFAIGVDVKWYDAPTGGNLLLLTDTLVDGHMYYASQTIGACESQSRLAVTVTVILIKTVNIHFFLEGLFNYATGNSMVEAQDIDWGTGVTYAKFGTGIADKIQVELYDETPPYISPIVNISGTDLTTDGLVSFQISPSLSGNYYIKIRTRNHLETWSAQPVPFNVTTIDYNFTTSSLNAYQAPGGIDPQTMLATGVYAFYLGDLDQSKGVDFDDFNVFEPFMTEGTYGFTSSDFNGNGLVDFDDFNLFEPNLNFGPFAQYPGMVKK